MTWVKRNLYFLILILVALVLLGVGGWYLYDQYSAEAASTDQIKSQYAQWNTLNITKPHPGSGNIDNIKIAKEQEKQLRDFIAKARTSFQPVTPIPDAPRVSNVDLDSKLRSTISQLRREAEQSSVSVPHDYYFTFEAERRVMVFDAPSLEKLPAKLGEMKAICEVLFAAKVNELYYIKRELVSVTNDVNQVDYTSQKVIATPLADLTPYEISFRCFSSELAAVLSGFANSPNGMIVKTLNVEPAGDISSQNPTPQPFAANPNPVTPYPQPAVPTGPNGISMYPQGMQPRYLPPTATAPVAPAAPAAPATPARGGLTTFLTEHALRVTMTVEVARLKAGK